MKTDANSNAVPAGAAKAYLYRQGESELRWMGSVRSHFLATGDSTHGGFCLVDERAHRGESVPLHRHPADMESIYVLEGTITLFLDGQPGEAAPAGTFVHIPAGAVHGFRVESDTARYLLLTTPRHGEFYRAITFPAKRNGDAPDEQVTGEMIEAACSKYGIEFVGTLPDS